MAFTVKQVAAMSGVSVRTLHFYDETGLLKPAFTGSNGYRFYEEPQLLLLQQILFYRELGFKLKDIRQIATRRDLREGVDLSRFLRQTVRSQNSLNGELTHGIVSTEVYEG